MPIAIPKIGLRTALAYVLQVTAADATPAPVPAPCGSKG